MSQNGVVSSRGSQIHADGQFLNILSALQLPLNPIKVGIFWGVFNVSHCTIANKNISLFLGSSIHSSHLSLFGTTYGLYQLYDLRLFRLQEV
ncbi:hypothetical protein I79_010443 [Cricetulus griseus]|uniref:Uncharacterized protein n=1 Tax=Cricetulus griseus TaxID=10029 RepID=G3HIH3_CRIGR|nr:hypothetical protein I79_010443 [Cricetulus griseus]